MFQSNSDLKQSLGKAVWSGITSRARTLVCNRQLPRPHICIMTITNSSKKVAKATDDFVESEAQQILDSVERLHIFQGGYINYLVMLARLSHQINVNEWLKDNTDETDVDCIGVMIEFFTDLIKIKDAHRADIHLDDSEMNALRNLENLVRKD